MSWEWKAEGGPMDLRQDGKGFEEENIRGQLLRRGGTEALSQRQTIEAHPGQAL
jgi:hypothetical protein